MIEVCVLKIYGYGKPLKNKDGEVIGETLDFKGDLRLPNEVMRGLGIKLQPGKKQIPLLLELRNGVAILKLSKELEHDDVIMGAEG